MPGTDEPARAAVTRAPRAWRARVGVGVAGVVAAVALWRAAPVIDEAAAVSPCAWFADAQVETFALSPTPPVEPLPLCEDVYSAALLAGGEDIVLCFAGDEVSLLRPREGNTAEILFRGPAPARPNAFARTARGEPGLEQAVIGHGLGRGAPAGPASVEVWAGSPAGLCRARVLATIPGERQQVASIGLGDTGEGLELHVTAFVEKYETVTFARRIGGVEGWREQDRKRMGTSAGLARLAVEGPSRRVLGRLYGDGPGTVGDLTVFERGPEQGDLVRTQGGVRALHVADLDRDGIDEVYFGDGWHQDYGERARYRLNRWPDRVENGERLVPELVDERATQYTVARIDALDVDGDPELELFASGNRELFRYDLRPGGRLVPTLVGDVLEHGAFAIARRPGKPALAILPRDGVPPEIVVLGDP